jgi:hypothetical protein
MYDKQTRRFKQLPIDKVAQAPNYYPDDVEIYLNEKVEMPGSDGIEKLLRNQYLSEEERWSVAKHIFIMHSRGPRRRRLNQGKEVAALAKVIEKMHQDLICAEALGRNVQPHREELRRLEEKWSKQVPEFVDRMARTPFESPNTISAVSKMAWHVFPAAEGYAHITSDTPARFFEGLGIATPDAEFTITLSKEIALVGNNRGIPGTTTFYSSVSLQTTKEINRRIISTTERFIYSSESFAWIDVVGQKQVHYLSNIRW